MNAFLRFNKGMLSMPTPSRLWLLVLVAFNALAPMFFLPRLEALATLGALAVSMSLMTLLTHWTGFSRERHEHGRADGPRSPRGTARAGALRRSSVTV